MATAIQSEHAAEVKRGGRFRFGKNWAGFLRRLTVPRIRLAEESLRQALQVDRLDGLAFLDVGSGSGLFSLTARRLGATVTSFDYDPDSVRCTQVLKQRYFPDDPHWRVEQGSALDEDFLRGLGRFDIVYSWGVLHHTGDMWRALRLIEPTVKVGGTLFISLYNDQGEATDRWAKVKRRYNALPRPLAMVYAVSIIAREEAREFVRQWRAGTPGDWLRTWTEYDQLSTRGMSRWHDWIDWIGGHPYERVRIEPIVDFYAQDGFQLVNLIDRSVGYGCNEFVFHRIADAGVQVESRIPRSASMARRFGVRPSAPFERDEAGTIATVESFERKPVGSRLVLIKNDSIVGEADWISPGRIRIPAQAHSNEIAEPAGLKILDVEDRPVPGPFTHVRGKMYEAVVSDLAPLSDNEDDTNGSPVHIFEDDVQLPMPHATHDEIARFGAGRFSHWGTALYFSASDGSDPNRNGRSYRLMMPPALLGRERSAMTRGIAVGGPYKLGNVGWTGSTASLPNEEGVGHFLLRNGKLLGAIRRDAAGDIIIASAEVNETSLSGVDFAVLSGKSLQLAPPFGRIRGQMYEMALPELAVIADRPGADHASPLLLFEDGHQLPYAHALHDDIDQIGRGRFSHWEGSLYFSSSDGTDPNFNERDYRVIVAV